MSENIYAASNAINESNVEKNHENHGKQYFYVISKKKFFLLYILTCGFYAPYWIYRHWHQFRGATMEAIQPIPRGIFFIFFVHSLATRISEHLNEAQLALVGNIKVYATGLAGIVLTNRLLQRAAEKGMQIDDNWLLVLDLGSVFVTAMLGWQIQRAANLAEADQEGSRNAKFSTLNYVWLVLGVTFWILVIIGFMTPNEGAA